MDVGTARTYLVLGNNFYSPPPRISPVHKRAALYLRAPNSLKLEEILPLAKSGAGADERLLGTGDET